MRDPARRCTAVLAWVVPLVACLLIGPVTAGPAPSDAVAALPPGTQSAVPTPRQHTAVESRVDPASVTTARRARGTVRAPRTVDPRARYTVVATVPWHARARRARTVLVQVRTGSRWRTVRVARTGRVRRVTSLHTAPSTGTVAHRYVARRFRGLPRYVSPVATVSVRTLTTPPPPAWDPSEAPPPTPAAGDAEDWALLGDRAARWNPCRVVRWSYRGAGSYPGSFEHVQRWVARVAGATGLRFRHVGSSDLSPSAQQEAEGVDLQIGWEPGDAFGLQVAGTTHVWSVDTEPGRDAEIVAAYVSLNLDIPALLPQLDAAAGEKTTGQLFGHELMHAVGLGHARRDDQLMYWMITANARRFGAGDLAGLRRVGALNPCF